VFVFFITLILRGMAEYASFLPRDTYLDCFFKAVLSIHRNSYKQAQMVYGSMPYVCCIINMYYSYVFMCSKS